MFEPRQFEPTEKFPRDWGGGYASGGRDDCEHERVFSGERFVCGNPAWHWICSKCGRIDVCQFVDSDVKPAPESIDPRRFARLANDLRDEPFYLAQLARREARQNEKTPPQPARAETA